MPHTRRPITPLQLPCKAPYGHVCCPSKPLRAPSTMPSCRDTNSHEGPSEAGWLQDWDPSPILC